MSLGLIGVIIVGLLFMVMILAYLIYEWAMWVYARLLVGKKKKKINKLAHYLNNLVALDDWVI